MDKFQFNIKSTADIHQLLKINYLKIDNVSLKISEVDQIPDFIKHGVIWNLGAVMNYDTITILTRLAKFYDDESYVDLLKSLNIIINPIADPSFIRFYMSNTQNFIGILAANLDESIHNKLNSLLLNFDEELKKDTADPIHDCANYTMSNFVELLNKYMSAKYNKSHMPRRVYIYTNNGYFAFKAESGNSDGKKDFEQTLTPKKSGYLPVYKSKMYSSKYKEKDDKPKEQDNKSDDKKGG